MNTSAFLRLLEARNANTARNHDTSCVLRFFCMMSISLVLVIESGTAICTGMRSLHVLLTPRINEAMVSHVGALAARQISPIGHGAKHEVIVTAAVTQTEIVAGLMG